MTRLGSGSALRHFAVDIINFQKARLRECVPEARAAAHELPCHRPAPAHPLGRGGKQKGFSMTDIRPIGPQDRDSWETLIADMPISQGRDRCRKTGQPVQLVDGSHTSARASALDPQAPDRACPLPRHAITAFAARSLHYFAVDPSCRAAGCGSPVASCRRHCPDEGMVGCEMDHTR